MSYMSDLDLIIKEEEGKITSYTIRQKHSKNYLSCLDPIVWQYRQDMAIRFSTFKSALNIASQTESKDPLQIVEFVVIPECIYELKE